MKVYQVFTTEMNGDTIDGSLVPLTTYMLAPNDREAKRALDDLATGTNPRLRLVAVEMGPAILSERRF